MLLQPLARTIGQDHKRLLTYIGYIIVSSCLGFSSIEITENHLFLALTQRSQNLDIESAVSLDCLFLNYLPQKNLFLPLVLLVISSRDGNLSPRFINVSFDFSNEFGCPPQLKLCDIYFIFCLDVQVSPSPLFINKISLQFSNKIFLFLSFFLSFFWLSSFEFRNQRLNEKNQMKNWDFPFRRLQADIIRVSLLVIFHLRFPLIGQI